jgi:two-component sensor histidine kinase/PAS domain-containing protein
MAAGRLLNQGCVVLQQLSEQVRECYRRAADAKAQADAATDPALKKSYSDLEDRWVFLARSHMFTESLQVFLDQTAQRKERAPIDPKLPMVGQLFDLLPVAIYVCDPSGLIIYYNSHAAELWGRSPSLNDPTDRFCGSYRMYHLDGGPIEHPDCPMAEVLRSGVSVQNREIVVERADGSRGVVLVNINPFKDYGGNILGALNCFQDVTERKRSERQIATLAGEAEHRAKNILATVQATVHLSQSDTVGGLKDTIEARIEALAKVHTLFMQSRWAGAELSSIAEQELAPYLRGGQPRVRIDGPDLLLAPNKAQAVAVILHELSTNAAKYGSLSVPEGQVEITWSRAARGQLILHWIESGGPPANKPTREGFGTSIINGMIRQLKGEIHRDWRAQGLACGIVLQL